MECRVNKAILELVQGDITDQATDAIVNAANSQLVLGGGVAGAIRRKGGPAIQEECRQKAPIEVGEAAITTGGDLKARYVIHTVGPRMGEGDEDVKLKNATWNALKLADENKLKSIAFPAISTGIFGFPMERCAEVMIGTIIEYLSDETGLQRVVICLFDKKGYKTFVERTGGEVRPMRAMAIVRCGALEEAALEAVEIDKPEPAAGQILLKVLACGVCHTELDQIEGRLRPGRLPVVPGHQIVGEVVEAGSGADRFAVGQRVGVTWLRSACMQCRYCDSGRENLCDAAQWTGHDADGGYAEMTTADERFAYAIPEAFDDAEAAPLLCAGVIGYRALRLAGIEEGHVVGLFGFGASAHIVIQVVRHLYPNNAVFVFTRGARHREHAKQLGAAWVGGPEDRPPAALDRAIDFTPVGETIKRALEVSAKGARLVVNAIRKRTPIPEMEYARHLWHEREITSVANVTAADAEEFLPLAGRIPIRPKVTVYPLAEANEALKELKAGGIDGAAVLKP